MDDPPDILLTNYKMLDRLLTTPRRQRLVGREHAAQTARWMGAAADLSGARRVPHLRRRSGDRCGDAAAPTGPPARRRDGAIAADWRRAGRDLRDPRLVADGSRGHVPVREPGVRCAVRRCRRSSASSDARSPRSVRTSTSRCRRRIRVRLRGSTCRIWKPAEMRWRRRSPALASMTPVRSVTVSCGITSPLRCCVSRRIDRGCGRMPSRRSRSRCPIGAECMADDPAAVGAALERFVALVSQARGRTTSGAPRPLFSVEVQVWIRAVTRLLRSVDKAPRLSVVGLAGGSRGIGDRAARPSTARHAGARAGWRWPTAPPVKEGSRSTASFTRSPRRSTPCRCAIASARAR